MENLWAENFPEISYEERANISIRVKNNFLGYLMSAMLQQLQSSLLVDMKN